MASAPQGVGAAWNSGRARARQEPERGDAGEKAVGAPPGNDETGKTGDRLRSGRIRNRELAGRGVVVSRQRVLGAAQARGEDALVDPLRRQELELVLDAHADE